MKLFIKEKKYDEMKIWIDSKWSMSMYSKYFMINSLSIIPNIIIKI